MSQKNVGGVKFVCDLRLGRETESDWSRHSQMTHNRWKQLVYQILPIKTEIPPRLQKLEVCLQTLEGGSALQSCSAHNRLHYLVNSSQEDKIGILSSKESACT